MRIEGRKVWMSMNRRRYVSPTCMSRAAGDDGAVQQHLVAIRLAPRNGHEQDEVVLRVVRRGGIDDEQRTGQSGLLLADLVHVGVIDERACPRRREPRLERVARRDRAARRARRCPLSPPTPSK